MSTTLVAMRLLSSRLFSKTPESLSSYLFYSKLHTNEKRNFSDVKQTKFFKNLWIPQQWRYLAKRNSSGFLRCRFWIFKSYKKTCLATCLCGNICGAHQTCSPFRTAALVICSNANSINIVNAQWLVSWRKTFNMISERWKMLDKKVYLINKMESIDNWHRWECWPHDLYLYFLLLYFHVDTLF